LREEVAGEAVVNEAVVEWAVREGVGGEGHEVSNEVSQGFRLSPQQKQAWAARQAGAPAAARCAVRIEGPLRAAPLEAALRQTVERHEILRTGFHSLPGMKFPVQVVGVASVSWEAISLRDAAAAEQQRIVDQLFAQTVPRGDETDADDARVARVRASLLGLSDERHVLLLSLPALAADEHALENLTAELARRYAAGVGAGEEADDPVQYVQFSEWQNELLEDEADAEAGAGREFWRRQLSHDHAAPRLPFEGRPAGAGFETASVAFELGARVLRDAEAAACAEDATVESALLAGWHALLWHLLRHETVVVCRRFDGRKFDELRAAVGIYDAELPIPVTLEEGEESLAFSRLVRRVGNIVRDGERWQEYFPWPSGEGRGSFAYGFDYAEASRPYAAGGVVFTLAERRGGASRFKLKLRCTRHPDKLAAELQYDAGLYECADVELLARRYARLLGDALGDPRRAVSRLNVVGADERRRVLEEFNDTREEFPGGVCFHELFEAQVARAPEATAVVCEDERLTYGELNARANRLAHHLRALGTEPESRVALLAERSTQTVVALLAVLKAGGAYVPLDAALPPARLASMLEDSGATVLIRERRAGVDSEVASSEVASSEVALSNSADLMTGARGVTVVCLDADAGAIAAGSAENPGVVAADHNLAYVIYTSGSTGRPKGVAVEHRQLSNYVHTIRQRLALPAPANYAIVSTFAADLGHTMTFPALASGGTLHVISQERSADAPALADYFSRHEIDCLKIVPSHLAALLASDDAGRVLPRRRLILGGEAAPPELAARVRRLAPACRVFNHYGPTETTVGVLTHEVAAPASEVVTGGGEPDSTTDEGGAREAAARRTLPLGRAIANARVYLLDAELQPVPFGAPGELHVAGAPVARGYLNHAAATAEKFVPDPFAAEPGARLYRTGDVARFLPDGNLEFLGRRDQQVKIRGYRVELGEVESAVRRHAGVRECVVVARGAVRSDESGSNSANGERRIVAYVVAQRGQRPGVAELRAAVHGWLPEYMTPSAFVVLDKLPLTPNGKVDLRALPSPEETQSGREYVAPRTDLEDVLAGLWAEVLGCERVGVHDNFFELGGHSLLAMRITSRLREIFRVELQLRALFEATTVEDLARALTASEAKPGQFESVARVLKKIKGMSAAGVRETLQARKS
jgi:amino acid adenylation domain-containing protein